MPAILNGHGVGHPTQHLLPPEDQMGINVLSPEVKEIISYKPGWIIRNGSLLFLLIVSLFIILTFFISYPDIIHANARLTSINNPKEMKAKTGGKLIKLNAVEGDFVHKNEILGLIESRANHAEVLALLQLTDTLQAISDSDNTENLSKYNSISYKNLGEMQQSFQTFMQSFYLYNQYLSKGYYFNKKRMLNEDIKYLKRLHDNLTEQKSMQTEDLLLAKQTIDANKSLDEDKVISSLDYRNEQSKYIGKALNIPQITATIISNEASQHEKQKEIAQLENEIAQQKGIFVQSLNTLKASLEEWKNNFLLLAPIDGKIAFASFFQENQQLNANETICFINPVNSGYFAEINIPQNNFGKIRNGNKVVLKLNAYPYQEFGSVTGTLDVIATIPTDSGFTARINLPNGLFTNYKKQLQYKEGLAAEAELITEDTKLSDRIFNSAKSLISKHD